MENELISVLQVADELGKRKQRIFKILGRLGIERKLIKNNDARGQKIAYITADDYTRVKEYFLEVDNTLSQITIDSDSAGVFYLIQLEPEHDPGRFTLGFAASIEERLRSHKTSAPFSTVLKTWPSKLLWEKTAIDCASQGCERLHTEVFRAKSIEAVLARCDEFFAIMPKLDDK